MGADENAELIRRGYAAFNMGDMETLTGLFDENASWHTLGRSPIAGDNVGREAAFVVGIHHNTAERDGKVVDGREHFYDLHAWDEFWS